MTPREYSEMALEIIKKIPNLGIKRIGIVELPIVGQGLSMS